MSKTRDFYNAEKIRQSSLIKEGFFGADENGHGDFKGKSYTFVLEQKNTFTNLYDPIRTQALSYFDDNKIDWWAGKKPTGHLLSSQIACAIIGHESTLNIVRLYTMEYSIGGFAICSPTVNSHNNLGVLVRDGTQFGAFCLKNFLDYIQSKIEEEY